jgi:hypothetical protein
MLKMSRKNAPGKIDLKFSHNWQAFKRGLEQK